MGVLLNSKLILAKNIKLDRNYTNVLNYTENQMLSLLQSNNHLVDYDNNCSFLRPTENIRTNISYEKCLQSNYIAFQNPNYSNKWFFAFIDEVIFKGDNCCEITYTIDSWSTWFDKWNTKPCYVIREHVNDDTIGLHTVPENLDIGDVVCQGETSDISYSDYYWVGVLTSHNPITNDSFSEPITIYNKNVLPKKLVLFEASDLSNLVNLGLFLMHTNKNNHTNDIDSIFYIPDTLIKRSQLVENNGTYAQQNYTFYTLSNNFNITEFNTIIDKVTSFSDITVKNNKLFTYPYNYLFVTNNIGNSNIYKYEDFYSSKCVFKNQITMAIGISGRIVPLQYKSFIANSQNDDEIISLAKYPTLSWSSDSFTSWLTTQAVNMPTTIATSLIPSVSTNSETGATNVDITGNVMNTANLIGNLIGGFYSGSMLPNVSHGQNTADIGFLSNRNTFVYKNMRCKKEYLAILDDYFSRFGYKINRVKIPNITGRTYWNYVEIAPSEEIGNGDVPTIFMQNINNACRKGVTIWHNHENIGNYLLNNSII